MSGCDSPATSKEQEQQKVLRQQNPDERLALQGSLTGAQIWFDCSIVTMVLGLAHGVD
jgi:hypothetical protein